MFSGTWASSEGKPEGLLYNLSVSHTQHPLRKRLGTKHVKNKHQYKKVQVYVRQTEVDENGNDYLRKTSIHQEHCV